MNDVSRPASAERATRPRRRSRLGALVCTGVAVAVLGGGWIAYSRWVAQGTEASHAPAPSQVVVSTPLQRELGTRLGFLGQFSAVNKLELRAQVGGTLTEIHFRDGEIVHQGDLLFVIDPVPYDIRLAQSRAQLESAKAKLDLADRELTRAQALRRTEAGSAQNVDQRASDMKAAKAAVDDVLAQIRDAEFDVDHTRITAPFTGRIGTHLVSVGNLVAGSRAGTSPTTLLATLVSTDPIYLNFDMSEADFLAFSYERAGRKGALSEKIEIALGNEKNFSREGKLDFVDNVLDRSSGTLHARATVPNDDLLLTPGVFARVRLALGVPVATLLVPDIAVIPDQADHVVLTVASDNTVVPRHVQVGDMRGGLRVIRSGLQPTDKVVIEGIPFAVPGAKVAPQNGTIQFLVAQGKD